VDQINLKLKASIISKKKPHFYDWFDFNKTYTKEHLNVNLNVEQYKGLASRFKLYFRKAYEPLIFRQNRKLQFENNLSSMPSPTVIEHKFSFYSFFHLNNNIFVSDVFA
jgi:hypothetical protein